MRVCICKCGIKWVRTDPERGCVSASNECFVCKPYGSSIYMNPDEKAALCSWRRLDEFESWIRELKNAVQQKEE